MACATGMLFLPKNVVLRACHLLPQAWSIETARRSRILSCDEHLQSTLLLNAINFQVLDIWCLFVQTRGLLSNQMVSSEACPRQAHQLPSRNVQGESTRETLLTMMALALALTVTPSPSY
jgi:hypothetical protein